MMKAMPRVRSAKAPVAAANRAPAAIAAGMSTSPSFDTSRISMPAT